MPLFPPSVAPFRTRTLYSAKSSSQELADDVSADILDVYAAACSIPGMPSIPLDEDATTVRLTRAGGVVAAHTTYVPRRGTPHWTFRRQILWVNYGFPCLIYNAIVYLNISREVRAALAWLGFGREK